MTNICIVNKCKLHVVVHIDYPFKIVLNSGRICMSFIASRNKLVNSVAMYRTNDDAVRSEHVILVVHRQFVKTRSNIEMNMTKPRLFRK